MGSPGPPPALWEWAALAPCVLLLMVLLRRGLVREAELPLAPFTLVDLLMVLLIYLGVSVLLERAADIPFLPVAWAAGLLLLLADSAGASMVLLAGRAADPTGAALGIARLPRGRNALAVGLILAVFLIPCEEAAWLWSRTLEWAGHPPVHQRAVELYVESWARRDLVGGCAISLGALLGAPLFEELLFRGLLFGMLRRRVGDGRAMVLSSLAFALFHLQPEVVVPVFLVGLVLNLIYVRTGSLACSVLFHLGFNGTSLAVMLFDLWNAAPGT